MREKERAVIVGGGLAGSGAAWQLAQRGVPLVLHEMRAASPVWQAEKQY